MRRIIIGVMGHGENATANDLQNAYILGQLIAKQGWVLRKDSGGRVLTRGTLEGEYHKYEPKPASRFRPRKLEPVIKRRTGRDNY